MNKKFILFCKEANQACDKAQYNEISVWEKLKLNLHLLMCSACRKYTKGNKKLTKVIKIKKSEFLSTPEKKILQANFEKELEKYPH